MCQGPTGVGQVIIGTLGWWYDQSRGIFYPSHLKPKEWVSYYSRSFDNVEINSSFYRPRFPNMVKEEHLVVRRRDLSAKRALERR